MNQHPMFHGRQAPEYRALLELAQFVEAPLPALFRPEQFHAKRVVRASRIGEEDQEARVQRYLHHGYAFPLTVSTHPAADCTSRHGGLKVPRGKRGAGGWRRARPAPPATPAAPSSAPPPPSLAGRIRAAMRWGEARR